MHVFGGTVHTSETVKVEYITIVLKFIGSNRLKVKVLSQLYQFIVTITGHKSVDEPNSTELF